MRQTSLAALVEADRLATCAVQLGAAVDGAALRAVRSCAGFGFWGQHGKPSVVPATPHGKPPPTCDQVRDLAAASIAALSGKPAATEQWRGGGADAGGSQEDIGLPLAAEHSPEEGQPGATVLQTTVSDSAPLFDAVRCHIPFIERGGCYRVHFPARGSFLL